MLLRRYYRNGDWFAPALSLHRDLRRLERDMGLLLGGTRGPIQRAFPALNLWVSDDAAMVVAELPGVETDALDIAVVGDTLTIKGNRAEPELPEGARYQRRERSFGEFARTVELPFLVDVEHVEAKFSDGILQLTLPRIPEEKPKKIAIKAA